MVDHLTLVKSNVDNSDLYLELQRPSENCAEVIAEKLIDDLENGSARMLENLSLAFIEGIRSQNRRVILKVQSIIELMSLHEAEENIVIPTVIPSNITVFLGGRIIDFLNGLTKGENRDNRSIAKSLLVRYKDPLAIPILAYRSDCNSTRQLFTYNSGEIKDPIEDALLNAAYAGNLPLMESSLERLRRLGCDNEIQILYKALIITRKKEFILDKFEEVVNKDISNRDTTNIQLLLEKIRDSIHQRNLKFPESPIYGVILLGRTLKHLISSKDSRYKKFISEGLDILEGALQKPRVGMTNLRMEAILIFTEIKDFLENPTNYIKNWYLEKPWGKGLSNIKISANRYTRVRNRIKHLSLSPENYDTEINGQESEHIKGTGEIKLKVELEETTDEEQRLARAFFDK